MPKINRLCMHCGKEFFVYASVIRRNKGKFCSKPCSDMYHVGENNAGWSRIYKECPRCGKTFVAQYYLLERGFGKYCSKKCSSESQKTSVDRICAQCGKSFSAWPARVAIGKGKYCSKQCGWLGGREQVQRSCKICGNTFLKNPSDIKRGNGIYCSPACQSIGNSGENHFAWRGGVGFGPYCPKFNKKFKENVRDKFNRKCYSCHKTEKENGEKLSVHHIDYNHNSICNGKEWAFVPLCRKHHALTNTKRWYWFNLWICYWAMNPEINFEVP